MFIRDYMLIAKFRSWKNYYIYDAATNNILKVDKIVYDIIDDFYKDKRKVISK